MSPTHVNRLRRVSVADTLTLEKGIVDLWYYFYEGIVPELASAQWALLTPGEREDYGKFYLERDRLLYLATRALVRTVLSYYSSVSPADWRFATGEHGKPRASAPSIEPTIHFNVANAEGLVVCAVSVVHEALGVDVEPIDLKVEAVELSDRCFSTSELAEFRALPASEQKARFFAHWTLKESYVKAKGLGLALPLDQMSFLIEDEIRVELDPRLADDASSWRFALIDVPPHYLIAISVKTGASALSLRAQQVVPLATNFK
jgi:4'-phosphopantetheinyl transferase